MGWIGDHQWEAWLIAAAVLAGLELVSLDLILIMLAGGALVGAVLSVVGLPTLVACLGALVTAVALLGLLRPNMLHRIHSGPSLRTGVDALIGTRAHVLSPVSGRPGGRIKIGGEDWAALAFDESDRFGIGDIVDVVEIRGATAYVLRSNAIGGSTPELPSEEKGE
ncbi:MAG TPA: NfeD family protein [Marmoricola sp.]